ncbi:hypothetical protein T03_2142, partial [Trichinella britovi]
LGAVDGCKRALKNCTGAGRTGGALHDSPITSQLTQRLHRSLGYVITTVSKIRSISCNDRLFSQMYEQNDEEFNRLLMVVESWLCYNTTLGARNFINFQALLHSGKMEKYMMMAFNCAKKGRARKISRYSQNEDSKLGDRPIFKQ